MIQNLVYDQQIKARGASTSRFSRLPALVVALLLLLSLGLHVTLAHAPALATTSGQTPLLETPDPAGDPIENIPAGTEVELTGATAIGFVGVTWNGSTGWVAATMVVVDNPDGIPLTTATANTKVLAAPLRDADPLGAIPVGGVVMLTGASNGAYVAGSYGGVGGWILESDLELPYDADSGTGQ